MASQDLFDQNPPFPDGLQVANLPRVALHDLLAGNANEAVFNACCRLGFFLLDLRGDMLGEQVTDEIDRLISVGKSAFNLSTDEKMRFQHDDPKQPLGYKACGEFKMEIGEADRHELFSVGVDDILGNGPPHLNIGPIEQERVLLLSFLIHGRHILSHILRALSTQLSLDPEALQDLHPADKPSGSTLRLFRYGASISDDGMRTSLIPDTDWGSVTLLANLSGGLQILQPGFDAGDERGWKWVKPEPGCLIVNMGDAMVEWTAGILRSNMQRVNYSPGQQRYVDRHGLALLFRGHKTAPMARLAGGYIPTVEEDKVNGSGDDLGSIDVPAHAWEVKKAKAMFEGKEIANSRGGRMIFMKRTAR